jgi:eukaryotic-like serine/threonine-protein kinase
MAEIERDKPGDSGRHNQEPDTQTGPEAVEAWEDPLSAADDLLPTFMRTHEENSGVLNGAEDAVDLFPGIGSSPFGDIFANPEPSLFKGPPGPELPEAIGRYQVERVLGQGGMGTVYECHDPSLDRTVALKVITGLSDSAQAEFLREVQIAGQLNHPGIVTVYDADIDANRGLYVVMQVVQGEHMDDMRKKMAGTGPLTTEQQVELSLKFAEFLDALHFAHEKGVLHLDIKPANVKVNEDGVKIMDFGLARAPGKEIEITVAEAKSAAARVDTSDLPLSEQFLSRVEPLAYTRPSGGLKASLAYMSPEVAGQQPDLDRRSDIYSSAVMYYEILTSKTPFAINGLMEAIISHGMRTPPNPHTLQPGLDNGLVEVCMKGMEKDPEQRYQTAAEFAGAVREVCRKV